MSRDNWFVVFLFILMLTTALPASTSDGRLDLSEAVEKALERNSRIYQSDRDVEISRLNFIKALGVALPKVNVRYDYSHLRYRENETTISFGGQSFTTTGPQDFDYNTATLSVYQPILSGGRDWILFFGAFDTVRLNKAINRRTRQEVIYDVKESYYQVLSLSKLMEVMENAKRQMAEHLKVAKALFRQGMVVKTDVLRADLGLATATQNLIKTKNALRITRATLNFLIDEDVDVYYSLVDDNATAESPLSVSYDECLKFALRYRPGITRMKAMLALDKKSVWLARADYFPSLSLFYTHKLEGGLMVKDDPDYWDDTSEEESWLAGGTMELQLFNGWLTTTEVREAKINVNKTRRRFSDVIKNIKLEVLSAYANVEESRARRAVSRKSEEQSQENYRIINLQYKEGMVQSINVMEAHTAFLNAQTEALASVFDYKLALAALEKAVGLTLKEGAFVND